MRRKSALYWVYRSTNAIYHKGLKISDIFSLRPCHEQDVYFLSHWPSVCFLLATLCVRVSLALRKDKKKQRTASSPATTTLAANNKKNGPHYLKTHNSRVVRHSRRQRKKKGHKKKAKETGAGGDAVTKKRNEVFTARNISASVCGLARFKHTH